MKVWCLCLAVNSLVLQMTINCVTAGGVCYVNQVIVKLMHRYSTLYTSQVLLPKRFWIYQVDSANPSGFGDRSYLETFRLNFQILGTVHDVPQMKFSSLCMLWVVCMLSKMTTLQSSEVFCCKCKNLLFANRASFIWLSWIFASCLWFQGWVWLGE